MKILKIQYRKEDFYAVSYTHLDVYKRQNQGFCAGGTQEDPSVASQSFCYLLHLCLNCLILLSRNFVLYSYIFKNLRIDFHLRSQMCIRDRLYPLYHRGCQVDL